MEKTSPLSPLEIETYFPFLKESDASLRQQFREQAVMKSLEKGAAICWEGEVCHHLAIVLSGAVRVYKLGENGREITLYRISEGELCVLTASCILSQSPFPAIAVVETPLRAVLLPAATLRHWMKTCEAWQTYIFSLLAKRLSDVILMVSEISFEAVQVRLAKYLLTLFGQRSEISITHETLAFELGTAREVVSRILKTYEQKNILSLSRGRITLKNKPALSHILKNRLIV